MADKQQHKRPRKAGASGRRRAEPARPRKRIQQPQRSKSASIDLDEDIGGVIRPPADS